MLWTAAETIGALPPSSSPPVVERALPQPAVQRPDRAAFLVDDAGVATPVQAPALPLLDCDTNYLRGDFNRWPIGRDIEDLAIMLNCVFVHAFSGFYCVPCVGDLNCDRRYTPADAAIFLKVLFSDNPDRPIRCPAPPGGK